MLGIQTRQISYTALLGEGGASVNLVVGPSVRLVIVQLVVLAIVPRRRRHFTEVFQASGIV